MADLTLRIAADFDKAQKAFADLANTSEETKKKMEAFSESFQNKNIDSFIDKQKLLEVSLKGTRGETQAMQASVNNYQKEIERLIKSGLAPNSEAVQKLANEQQKLKDKIKEANEIQKAQKDLMAGAEKACLAMWAAIGTGVLATAALTQKTAELGDELFKSSQRLGVSVEALQELDYAAKQNNIKDLTTYLDKLNVTMGDVKSGTGSLTKYLENNDKQLLAQLKNVKSNDEAFMLLMDSIGKAPDEFTKASLAQQYFGKSGKELILMANSGADGIKALREEAQKYGVMSTEAAKNSEEYISAQGRLKASLSGVSTELTSKLMPGITQTINSLANFIAGINDWESKLKIAGYALAGLTAGFTAFIVVTKGGAAIQVVTTAMKALNAAIAANPIGAIAVVITAVLIPAIIYLFKNWDTVKTYIDQGVARLVFAFTWFGSQIKEKFIIAVNSVKIGFLSLAELIVTKVLGAVASFLDVLGKLPFVGEQFDNAAAAVRRFSDGFSQSTEAAKESSRQVIQAAKDEQDAAEEAQKQKLANIDAESQARRAAIEAQKNQATEQMTMETEIANHAISETIRTAETQAQIQKEQVELEKKLNEDRLNSFGTFTNGFGQLLQTLGEENRAFAISGRVVASAEAAINTALAFTKALASAPWPLNLVAAAGTMAAGLAQQIKIHSTPIPSAETGGRFIVPQGNGVDNKLFRFNGGEEIDVTPRGMTGSKNESFNFNLLVDGQVFASVMNKQARRGELYTLQLASNY